MPESNRDRILVLGLGNDILTDDAVGLRIAQGVQLRIQDEPGIDVRESMEMGLTLLDHVIGFQSLILVDSVQTGKEPPGHIHSWSLDRFQGLHLSTPHFLGLADTFALAQHLGLSLPDDVHVFAVEVSDTLTLGTHLTPAVLQAIPTAIDLVVERARTLLALHTVEHYF